MTRVATRLAPHTFTLTPRGPYSFVASLEFLRDFTPAAYREAGHKDHLHLAFVADGGEEAAGVCVREEGGAIVGEVFGAADPAAVRAQVERILSLDVDGEGFPEVGRRDPVVGRLQARYPGLRPVNFYSTYEAAAWAIIAQRIRIVQAARLKDRMARELGPVVEVHGETLHAFPGPARLRELDGFAGLCGRKVEWLRALAEATQEGRRGAARLRALPVEQALAELRELPGIGAFGSEHILLRGAGKPDYLPWREPRIPRAIATAYGLPATPTVAEMQRIADNWRAPTACGSPFSCASCVRTTRTRSPAGGPDTGYGPGPARTMERTNLQRFRVRAILCPTGTPSAASSSRPACWGVARAETERGRRARRVDRDAARPPSPERRDPGAIDPARPPALSRCAFAESE